MKIILSPAKTFKPQSEVNFTHDTIPLFQKDADRIIEVLKSVDDLKAFYKCSSKVAQEAESYLKRFNSNRSTAAIFTYGGLVFQNLNSRTLDEKQIIFLQENLFILSGLYGILRPLDLISPYRLDISQNLPAFKKLLPSGNLYSFWEDKITATLNNHLQEGEPLLNLASAEYSKAVDSQKLKGPFVTVDFMQYQGDKMKSLATYSKQARGLILRYIADGQIESIEKLKSFSQSGYRFCAEASIDYRIVFVRDMP